MVSILVPLPIREPLPVVGRIMVYDDHILGNIYLKVLNNSNSQNR